MILKANDFLNRNDLEKIVKSQLGTGIKENREAGHEIRGTRKQLAKLQLDDRKTYWGIKCVITDIPTSKIVAERKKIKKPKR